MLGVRLICGDCLQVMPRLRAGSVHFVLADLPYGVTDCRWDRKIALGPLWAEYRRVLAPGGVVALFAQQPFATEVGRAGFEWLKYEWVWDKGYVTGFANARRMPMRRHENILIFVKQGGRYFPQGLRPARRVHRGQVKAGEVYGAIGRRSYVQRWTGYPQSILKVARERGAVACQKPVALLEYLIRTYTRRGEVVLDNAMGTGSTGVAAVRSGRRFVGIEIDRERFRIARRRILSPQRRGDTEGEGSRCQVLGARGLADS